MIALQVANPRRACQAGVFGALDTFGNDGEAEAFDEIDQVAQNEPLLPALREVSTKDPSSLTVFTDRT